MSLGALLSGLGWVDRIKRIVGLLRRQLVEDMVCNVKFTWHRRKQYPCVQSPFKMLIFIVKSFQNGTKTSKISASGGKSPVERPNKA